MMSKSSLRIRGFDSTSVKGVFWKVIPLTESSTVVPLKTAARETRTKPVDKI